MIGEGIIRNAQAIATLAHQNQNRKWASSHLPYITHPARVAAAVEAKYITNPHLIAAAWMHDVLEDTDFPAHEIVKRCGMDAYLHVLYLTNPSKKLKELSRQQRKEVDHMHLSAMPHTVKYIKLCDRLDNLTEMNGASPSFLAIYCDETMHLLQCIGATDEALNLQIRKEVERIRESISLVNPVFNTPPERRRDDVG